MKKIIMLACVFCSVCSVKADPISCGVMVGVRLLCLIAESANGSHKNELSCDLRKRLPDSYGFDFGTPGGMATNVYGIQIGFVGGVNHKSWIF